MSTVDLTALALHARDYGFAYLLTVTAHERVHTSVVHPVVDADAVTIPAASTRSLTNAAGHPDVSLVWPPAERNGYSLIVDGTAAASDTATLAIQPTRAILHRPAAEPSAPDAGDGCVQDCIEL